MAYEYDFLNLRIPPSHVISSFSTLEYDNYLNHHQNPFRKRAYATGNVKKNKVIWNSENISFFQNTNLNKYAGGITRTFSEISVPNKLYIENEIIPLFFKYFLNLDFEFGVHQIRITTQNDKIGFPAPEGIHQDGFDYVAVICLSCQNITGGTTLIVDATKHEEIILETILKEGDILFFDDKIYAHYTSPVVPKLPGIGHRDVFVITFSLNKEKTYVNNT